MIGNIVNMSMNGGGNNNFSQIYNLNKNDTSTYNVDFGFIPNYFYFIFYIFNSNPSLVHTICEWFNLNESVFKFDDYNSYGVYYTYTGYYKGAGVITNLNNVLPNNNLYDTKDYINYTFSNNNQSISFSRGSSLLSNNMVLIIGAVQ